MRNALLKPSLNGAQEDFGETDLECLGKDILETMKMHKMNDEITLDRETSLRTILWLEDTRCLVEEEQKYSN